MRRKQNWLTAAMVLGMVMLSGCAAKQSDREIKIVLSDDAVTVDGADASVKEDSAVYTGADIVYYMEGQDVTYGEGTDGEAHSPEEAAKHTVVTITRPGTYRVSGSLSNGQIAVDLGEEAEKDEEAVVNLILDNVDLTCTVAPAILVYNVYECGDNDKDTAGMDVDTSDAGFQLILADDSVNIINGSHVAKIYKEGTTEQDVAEGKAKKAHKYDAAIESMMSFNINTEEKGSGKLTVYADNEGIESRLHMTVNGGEITVNANDDSLNAGEDSVSVITINDGILTCNSGYGEGEEGDGIDSNGWIVIRGGYTIACANAQSADSGVDSDMGIYIQGGVLLASGHMYDEVSPDSGQNFIVLSFSEDVTPEEWILLTDARENALTAFCAANNYSTVVYSSPDLEEGDYGLSKVSSVTGSLRGSVYTEIMDYTDAVPLQYGSAHVGGKGPGGKKGGQGRRPEGIPENGGMPGEGGIPEEGAVPGEGGIKAESSTVFSLTADQYMFGEISEAAD